MIELIEAVKDTYSFIHPMNENPAGTPNFVEVDSEKQSIQKVISDQQEKLNISQTELIKMDITQDLYE